MSMPGFTAEASLAPNRAQYETLPAGWEGGCTALHPQLSDWCARDLAQLRHHYRDLVAAVSRQDWEVVSALSNAIQSTQRQIETSC